MQGLPSPSQPNLCALGDLWLNTQMLWGLSKVKGQLPPLPSRLCSCSNPYTITTTTSGTEELPENSVLIELGMEKRSRKGKGGRTR